MNTLYELFSGNSHHTVSEIGAVDIYQGINEFEKNSQFSWHLKDNPTEVKSISDYFTSNSNYYNLVIEQQSGGVR